MDKDEGSLVLGSKKFQELTNRKTQAERLEIWVKTLVDPKSGLLKKGLAVNRNCPICDEKPENSHKLFIKDGFPYRQCARCNIVYVSPMIKEDILVGLYQGSDYSKWYMEILLNPIEQQFDQPKFAKGLSEIENILGRKGRLLDVGCAVGHFLTMSKNAGWETVGIELNAEEHRHCLANGFKVIDKPLSDDLFPKATFDAVTLWEVLEHVPHPREILRSIYKILKPGGVVLIVVPNLDALAARVLREKCRMFSGYSHINMFNAHTLSNLLTEENFKVIQRSTIISEISVLNNYLQYRDPYLGDADSLHILFETINEDYIHKKLMGYKLKVIAKKS